MSVRSRIVPTTLSEVAHGDLVGIAIDGKYEYAIVLPPVQDGNTHLAVISTAKPHRWTLDSADGCVSYGPGWMIEVADAPSVETDFTVPGAVMITTGAVVMRIGSEPGRPTRTPIFLRLIDSEATGQPSGPYVLASGWRLWVDAADRDDPRAAPLIVSSSR